MTKKKLSNEELEKSSLILEKDIKTGRIVKQTIPYDLTIGIEGAKRKPNLNVEGSTEAKGEVRVRKGMILNDSAYINFGASTGEVGEGFRISGTQLQYKNRKGNWDGFGNQGPSKKAAVVVGTMTGSLPYALLLTGSSDQIAISMSLMALEAAVAL